MVDKNVVQDFLMAIQTSQKNVDHTYNATVTRVDDTGIVWVQLAGSDKETPTASTSSEVKMGDSVNVQWRNNKLYVAGNYSNPAAGSVRVNAVEAAAQVANQAASNAVADAGVARQAAESAQSDAARAKSAADGASEYAARAFGNLSTVQSITETLTWITQHGTMTLTTDVALDPTHVYFVQDAGGDYVVGGVTYAVVTEPDVADIGTYYVLTIDESLNNYVGTHLALTSEGLWLVPEAGGNKVLIATGGVGHTYADAGTYIIDENDNISAQFLEDGTTIYGPSNTLIAHLGYGPGVNSVDGTSNCPYYSLGQRKVANDNYDSTATYNVGEMVLYNGDEYVCIQSITAPEQWTPSHWSEPIGNYSCAEGIHNVARGYTSHAEGGSTYAGSNGSHAEGVGTKATGLYSHAEGYRTRASDICAHAEGSYTYATDGAAHAEGTDTIASGANSHAQNNGTKASSANQTSLGKFNIEDTADKYAVIVGNGTADNARSNALTVDWSGRVSCGDQAGNFKSIFDIFYPKGSYYETSLTNAIPSGNDTPNATDLQNLGITWFDPNYAWGGTWELETSGKFHISAGTGYGLGTGGGSPDAVVVKHNHTQNPHNHTQNAHHHIAFKYKAAQLPTGSSGAIRVWDYEHSGDSTANTNDVTATNIQQTATNIENGVDGTGKNIPPYIAVNRWHRTG